MRRFDAPLNRRQTIRLGPSVSFALVGGVGFDGQIELEALRLYGLPEERGAGGPGPRRAAGRGRAAGLRLMLDEARRANAPGLLMSLNVLINTLTGLPALGAVNAGRASSPARRRCRE